MVPKFVKRASFTKTLVTYIALMLPAWGFMSSCTTNDKNSREVSKDTFTYYETLSQDTSSMPINGFEQMVYDTQKGILTPESLERFVNYNYNIAGLKTNTIVSKDDDALKVPITSIEYEINDVSLSWVDIIKDLTTLQMPKDTSAARQLIAFNHLSLYNKHIPDPENIEFTFIQDSLVSVKYTGIFENSSLASQKQTWKLTEDDALVLPIGSERYSFVIPRKYIPSVDSVAIPIKINGKLIDFQVSLEDYFEEQQDVTYAIIDFSQSRHSFYGNHIGMDYRTLVRPNSQTMNRLLSLIVDDAQIPKEKVKSIIDFIKEQGSEYTTSYLGDHRTTLQVLVNPGYDCSDGSLLLVSLLANKAHEINTSGLFVYSKGHLSVGINKILLPWDIQRNVKKKFIYSFNNKDYLNIRTVDKTPVGKASWPEKILGVTAYLPHKWDH